MTSKILRSDNTPIPSIKSVVFTERINASADLRPGCVSSAYIDVTVFGAASSAPSAGEPLKYYQVDANGVETYIGTFYAEPSIQSRNTYSFVAYDIVSKLDVGFSERLLALIRSVKTTDLMLGIGVGHIGGRTEVLNRSQLAATMYSAVNAAMRGVSYDISAPTISTTDESTNEDVLYRAFMRAIADSDLDKEINLDGEPIYRAVVRRNRQNTRATGVNQLAMA